MQRSCKAVVCTKAVLFQVIQRRIDGSEELYRNWTEYENGFGSPCEELWIGACPLVTAVHPHGRAI